MSISAKLAQSIARSAAAFVIGCGVCVFAGCDKAGSPTAAADNRPADATYTTRGEVVSLPTKDKPTSEFLVKHEAIDTFVNPATGSVGMSAMTMPFTPGPGVSLSDLKVGDKVKITLDVWYRDMPGKPGKKSFGKSHVSSIEKLPAETVLEFRKAMPPAAAPTEPAAKP